MTLEKITTFTEVSDLYLRNTNQIINRFNIDARSCHPGIEEKVFYLQNKLDNTIDALICALELLKKHDATSTFDSKAPSAV